MSDAPKPPPAPNSDGEGAPQKRRPKDSEFFELPPDLKNISPGELPATVGSSSGSRHKGDTKKAGESPDKKGCAGLLLGLLAAGAATACLMLLAELWAAAA